MPHAYTALASDPTRRARIRTATLPPQYQLDRFLEHITPRHATWQIHTHACSWDGVSCSLDEQEEVNKIQWQGRSLRGVPEWRFLPETLTLLSLGTETVRGNKLQGPVVTECLPRMLQSLLLDENLFTGPLHVAGLPPWLKRLSVRANRLNGPLILNGLPRYLREIQASQNEFSDELLLSTLPPFAQWVYLDNNAFTGPIQLNHLPIELQELSLSKNRFSGNLDFSGLPPSLRTLILGENCFVGCVVFPLNLPHLMHLDISRNAELRVEGNVPENVKL